VLPDCYPVCARGVTGINVTEKTPKGGPKFDPIELRKNTAGVAEWSRQFEVPDIIHFADYAENSATVADDLQKGRLVVEGTPGPLLPFPYPKLSNNLRWLHVAGPEELIVLRTAAGHLLRLTDPLLSPRVCSNRLDHQGCYWRFRSSREAWSQFVRRGVSLLDGQRHSSMYRTDVEAYYPSVDIERLQALLKSYGCLIPVALLILKIFRNWQLCDGLQGLPIGPEVSGVLGNFLLHPIDISLEAKQYEHLRWCDDIVIFGRTIASCAGSIGLLDETLSMLGLTRSITKTLPFDNVSDARANLRDQSLASLTALLRSDENMGIQAVRLAYDAHIRGHPEVEKRRFRSILGKLCEKHDPYGCLSLAQDSALMNVDPVLSSRYLAETDLKDSRVIDAVMNQLSSPAQDRFEGLNLHLLNRMRQKGFGNAEAGEFRRIASDSSRRWPVRVYGWAAYVRTTQHYRELMDAARAESIPELRRGMITNLRGRFRRSFLDHARANFPESRYTVQWLQS
jgi:hypothetical protein